MTYRQCLDYLDRLGNEVLTMKFGLDNIRRLLERLGRPQLRQPSLLVAGTNGKGSVARFVGAILAAAGYRTGVYTSPHLIDVEERIAVDGRPIPRRRFARSFTRVADAVRDLDRQFHPTYFETLTATAFVEFAEADVDVAVLEVGMGGRLDSTNVVDPVASILTPIGMDHMATLGDTLEKIAFEKAGIIHPGRPVLSAPQHEAAMAVLRGRAESLGCPFQSLDVSEIEFLPRADGGYGLAFRGVSANLRVLGRHQAENAALAILASEALREEGWKLPGAAVEEGLSRAEPYAAVRRLASGPDVFIDGGHNPDAAQRLLSFLLRHTRAPRSLVLGMMRDKEIEKFVGVLRPAFESVHLTRIDSPRAASLQDLARIVPDGRPVADPIEAVRLASAGAKTVVVAGSFFLAGEVAKRLHE